MQQCPDTLQCAFETNAVRKESHQSVWFVGEAEKWHCWCGPCWCAVIESFASDSVLSVRPVSVFVDVCGVIVQCAEPILSKCPALFLCFLLSLFFFFFACLWLCGLAPVRCVFSCVSSEPRISSIVLPLRIAELTCACLTTELLCWVS